MEDKICVSATQLRTGIDIVHNEDMGDLADEMLGIVLTENEWMGITDLPNQFQQAAVAGRFACKEAIMKVLGHGIDEVELVDIEILHDRFGKPIVFLQGSALQYWRQTGCTQLEVSISHHKDYAVAIAVAMELNLHNLEISK